MMLRLNLTEGELTLCWRFDDELWIWFRNVTFIQLCIFCFFDRKSGQYVSKHRHFTMVWYVKGISAKNLASKRAISVFFVIIHPQQKTRCNRLRCPLARMSGLQYFNMGHNGHGINLYGVSMTLMGN